MSTGLDFYLCLNTSPHFSPIVISYLQAYLDDGFLERLEPALQKARPVPRPILNEAPSDDGEGDSIMSHDPYGEPLTYILPEDLDSITDTHPANQALLDFITKNTWRHALIVVLYWN